MDKLDSLYQSIETYANEKQLTNTKLALPLAKDLLKNILRQSFRQENKDTSSFQHCMEATQMLIELHIPFDTFEEDIMLASMLCHDMLENIDFPQAGEELVKDYHLDPAILKVVRLLTRPAVLSEENKKIYYEKIQEDKLAVLVALADRSNLVEQLSALSISDVNGFIHEMRKFLLPMCVYAKQYHRDCRMPVNILMEKIRCLIDVTDIIANRYQKREMAYTNEILSLMEENARIRGMIHQFDNGELH